MESRIEILNRLAYKNSRNVLDCITVDTFEEWLEIYSSDATIHLVQIAMLEYAKQNLNTKNSNNTICEREEEVLQTIFNCVSIRGIELELYKREFTDEVCGLYSELVKLFRNDSPPSEEQVLQTIFDSVFIRGIELELYKRQFTDEVCGLYSELVKLFRTDTER